MNTTSLSTLYVFNAAALSKPNAVQHLAADLVSTGASVAVITETHFKQKHTDSAVVIEGFTLFRRDTTGRRGGGVAVYVNSSVQSSVWSPTSIGSRAFELLWVRVGASLFVAALYHPPRPIYDTADLLSYIENCVAELSYDYPLAEIVLAGDLNQLSDDDVIERTGLTQIVRQPTRGANVLDRVFVSDDQLYSTVRVVPSVVRSDHKAVVAMSGETLLPGAKVKQQRVIRPKTPSMNAIFLQHQPAMDLGVRPNADELAMTSDPQAFYDAFYALAIGLLDTYYPERTITVTSRDPHYVTADIKAKLRRKNRLMRAGRVDEAGALARQIGRAITRQN